MQIETQLSHGATTSRALKKAGLEALTSAYL